MATPFVRVDLSDEARDFRPFALEPGVPMLDRSNANARILFRWLGGMVAEPEWEGDSVSFYVQNDRGGRLEEVVCQPASQADLNGPLKRDLETLKERIERVKPETATERAVKKMLRRSFAELVEAPQGTEPPAAGDAELDCYFFRYRDVQGRWRLVWCWGYRRGDQEPAPAVVCSRAECNLLFVRRPNQSPKCPCCEAGLVAGLRRKGLGKKAALLYLLLFLISAALLFWLVRPQGLQITPEKLDMVVGQIIDLKVEPPSDEPVRITSPDPAVVEITKENRLIARSQGTVDVRVSRANQSGMVEVTVTQSKFESIAVDPARVEVAVDDSIRTRVMARIAEDESSRKVEIAPDLLSCDRRPSARYAAFDPASMRLRGLMPTDPDWPQTLAFGFRGHRCSAPVEVVLPPFDLALEPAGPIDLPLGQQMGLEGLATYKKSGRRVQVSAGRMTFAGRRPPDCVPGLELRGNKVAALKSGAGPLEVYATYFDRQSPPVVFRSVDAQPVTLRLEVDRSERIVDETGRVILSGTASPAAGGTASPAAGGTASSGDVDLVPELAKYTSSDPSVVKIDERTGAFRATAAGEATITASHPAAGEPVSLTLSVAAPPSRDRPVAVRILTDQDQPVRFPVGAEFDDFYVEAEYADGFTRLVTKKATLRTPEPPQDALVTPHEGRLVGVRPGQTTITAEFEGVRSEKPLQAEVTGALDVDRIAIVPAKMVLLPGETVAMDVIGYKGVGEDGRSVGIITGLGNIVWSSSDPQIALIEGRFITGVNLGQGAVTAQLDGVVSQPVPVDVVRSIADALVIDRQSVRIRVGEGIRIGTDLLVWRGDMDISRQCTVTPALPGVVRYVPEIHSLVGVAPGASAVAFTFGDKLANAMVEVLPAMGAIDGEVIVEPARGTLAPGQALGLRVLVVGPSGERIDRTASAVLSSSDPNVLTIQGNLACAVGPGTAEITATLPGTESTGGAYLLVTNDEISRLIVEPPQAAISTGEMLRLRILGRAPSGTHEMFPQPGLTLTPAGPDPESIRIVGPREVRAIVAGQAVVAVDWRNRLSQQVAVTVTDEVLTDLRIEPARAVIHPGQPLVYQVTGLRGGRRRVLGPEHGVQLFVDNHDVAQVIDDLAVRANSPGRTSVVASVGGQRAGASLEVTSGRGPGGGDVLIGGTDSITYYGPGGGYWSSGRGGYWDNGYRYFDGDRWIYGPDYIEDVFIPPPADPLGLRFDPELLRLSPNSPPTLVRVFERLADGRLGREVTAEENLEITEPPGVVALERTANGPRLRPVAQGQVRLGARLGNLTADPLFVHVGNLAPGLARLLVAPDPLTLWSGQTGTFGGVMIDPGGGQLPLEIDYRVTSATNPGVVSLAGDRTIRALSEGATQVVVTAVNPGGAFDGLSTAATVQVTGADPLWIEPSSLSLRVGQVTRPLAVMAQTADGLAYQLSANLHSMDPQVLARDPAAPGRFVAHGLGRTQIRASHRGREAFAEVTVSGRRFVEVREIKDSLTGDAQLFEIALEVLAATPEGPLEYRVYVAGQARAGDWVAARAEDGQLRTVLRSPRIPYGPPGSVYRLIIEVRGTGGDSVPPAAEDAVQQYPFSFRLKQQVERADPDIQRGGRLD